VIRQVSHPRGLSALGAIHFGSKAGGVDSGGFAIPNLTGLAAARKEKKNVLKGLAFDETEQTYAA
jgi:hypothetical protein